MFRSVRRFGIIHNIFGLMNKSSMGYIAGTHPMTDALPNHNALVTTDNPMQYNVTRLPNGVQILTESTAFPHSVNIGICLAAGTRDEDPNLTGHMLALKNTALKSHERTNEQLNYCMVQMSGGEFEMDYSQEMAYYKTRCLEHDVYDMMQMMSDCVLDDSTVMDEEAAQWWADEYFKLHEQNYNDTIHLDEMILPTAFGMTGLGLPLAGFQTHFQNIGYHGLNEFRKNNMTPERMIVSASGINNHQEFLDVAAPYFENLRPAVAPKRELSTYLGGEYRINNESQMMNFFIGYQTAGWMQPEEHTAVHVLKTLVGSGGGFSTGGPGKGMQSRSITNFLMQYGFLESVKAVYKDFSDVGVFGISVVGMTEYCDYVGLCVLKEMVELLKVTDEEVERAKKLLKANLLITLERATPRLEEATKTFAYTGMTPDQRNIYAQIDGITKQQVVGVVAKMLMTKPTMVVVGGDNHKVPSVDFMHSRIAKK